MENLLQHAYVEQRCNACGGSYRVSLYDALAEHRVQGDWQSGRNCSLCSVQELPALSAIPAELLEGLNEAWERVVRAADQAHLDLKVGA